MLRVLLLHKHHPVLISSCRINFRKYVHLYACALYICKYPLGLENMLKNMWRLPHAGRGYYSPLLQPMKQPAPHGAEEVRFLAALWRLLLVKLADNRGQIPSAQHGGSGCTPGWLQTVQQAGPLQGVPTSASGRTWPRTP